MTNPKSNNAAATGPELGSLQELRELQAALDEHSIVAITDPQGRITYVNDKFCSISKYHREELIGQNHRIINSGYHSKEFFTQMWKCISKGHVWKNDIKNKAKDGTYYWVNTTIVPFKNEQGKIYQYVSIRTDITERKRLENQILDITEREQRRIGQDLHDGLGQQLTGIELLSRVLEQQLKKNKKAAEQASRIASHVRDAIAQTRSLARGLFPVELDSRGLMSALEELVIHTRKVGGIDCSLICKETVSLNDYEVATHLYRIAQEAVNNAIKHAKPSKILITLEQTDNQLTLTIQNNGSPFTLPKEGKEGMGLKIMKFRASAVGATFEIQTTQNDETKVICTVKKRP